MTIALILTPALCIGCRPARSGTAAKPAKTAPAASAAAVDTKVQVSQQEAQDFAAKFAAAVSAGDVEGVNRLMDWDEVLRRADEGIKSSEEAKQNVASDFKKSGPANLFRQISKQVKQGGRFELVRIHLDRAGGRMPFRLITAERRIDYYDVVVYRAKTKELKVADIFIAMSGELLSETARRGLLQAAAKENRSVVERLAGWQADYVKHIDTILNMTTDHRLGRNSEFLAAFGQLPPSLQREKSLLVMRIAAAQGVSAGAYSKAIDELLQHHPQDPCVPAFLVNAAYVKGDKAGALAALDKLDQTIGGDPYLDVLRGHQLIDMGKYKEARERLAKVETWNPRLLETQWLYVFISLREHDYDETVRRLSKLTDELGVKLGNLAAIPDYAEFIKSPQCAAWLKSQAVTQAPPR